MTEAAVQRRKDYYEKVYQAELERLQGAHLALDECIQHFLDQRPIKSKQYTNVRTLPGHSAITRSTSSFLKASLFSVP